MAHAAAKAAYRYAASITAENEAARQSKTTQQATRRKRQAEAADREFAAGVASKVARAEAAYDHGWF